MKLEAIQIERLRGIPGGWPSLAIGEKGLIVYGPNGVGKSSIIDAIEATIADRSTLFAENQQGVNWETAATHVNGGPPSVTITGNLAGKPLEISLGETPVHDLQDWIAEAKAASFVLRRYMLLKFINAVPKERYEQIEPFLNLDEFTHFELGLRGHVQELETTFTTAATNVALVTQRIQQAFGLDRATKLGRAMLMDILADRLNSSGIAPDDLPDLNKVLGAVTRELGGEVTNQKLASLNVAKHHALQLTSASALLPLFEQFLAACAELSAAVSVAVQKVPVQLLVDALGHLKVSPVDHCPICEQEINHAALMARLVERIKDDEAVQLAITTVNKRIKALRDTVTPTGTAYLNFSKHWAQLNLGPLPDCYAAAARLFSRLDAVDIKTGSKGKDQILAEFVSAECDPTAQISRLDEEIAAIGGGVRRTRLEEALTLLKSLQGDLAKFEKLQTDVKILSARKLVAAKLHAHAEAARKSAVQKIADKVAAVANAYYDEVHPGEGLASSRLIVREAVSGSMLISSTFHGQEAPPLKYYSESHLDTLGLCYFLAIRKLETKSTPNFKLLLVDDVLHSVDAEHRARIARLLKNEFADHQLVLVTHDKYFYDRLRATLGSGYKYNAFTTWDVQSGPRQGDASTDLDRVTIPEMREGRSHEELASAGGRFFEWMLKEICERLVIAIPARFTRDHDIGSMWPHCADRLRRHKGFDRAHQNLVKNLDDNTWVRNKVGAHYNETASGVTPIEVTEFLDQLSLLYSATHCDECGSFIQRIDSGAWRCDCPALHYEP